MRVELIKCDVCEGTLNPDVDDVTELVVHVWNTELEMEICSACATQFLRNARKQERNNEVPPEHVRRRLLPHRQSDGWHCPTCLGVYDTKRGLKMHLTRAKHWPKEES